MFYVVYLCKKIQTTYKMKTIDPTTLIIYLTVGQYLDLRRLERTLQEPTKKEFQKYLNPTQLSELIGWKITTVYQNHHNGLIPGAKKIGNRLLFDSAIILSSPPRLHPLHHAVDHIVREQRVPDAGQGDYVRFR